MKHLKWFLVVIFTLCLIGVRFVETRLFYDPFLVFFRITDAKFPNFDWLLLIINHFFRFFLNLVFSLGVIHFLFLNKKWTIQAGILITISFAIFFPIYLYCIYTEFGFGELFAFYIRRIIIQPVPLLILIPLFYYRKN